MSNETKRDVFEAVWNRLAGYQVFFNGWPRETLYDYKKRYDVALPDDLPVIPKSIGNFIKQSVYEDATLQEALECAHDKQFGVGRWISAHSEIFARAWILGVWRVEETGEIVKLEAEK
jgi:hypothetical protein